MLHYRLLFSCVHFLSCEQSVLCSFRFVVIIIYYAPSIVFFCYLLAILVFRGRVVDVGGGGFGARGAARGIVFSLFGPIDPGGVKVTCMCVFCAIVLTMMSRNVFKA